MNYSRLNNGLYNLIDAYIYEYSINHPNDHIIAKDVLKKFGLPIFDIFDHHVKSNLRKPTTKKLVSKRSTSKRTVYKSKKSTSKSCPKGKRSVEVKGYTRKNGTPIKSHYKCINN